MYSLTLNKYRVNPALTVIYIKPHRSYEPNHHLHGEYSCNEQENHLLSSQGEILKLVYELIYEHCCFSLCF